MESLWILSPALAAGAAGVFFLTASFTEYISLPELADRGEEPQEGESGSRTLRLSRVGEPALGALLTAAALAMVVAWSGDGEVILFHLMKDVPVYFRIDPLGRWFITLATAVWVPVGIYSIVYMRREGGEKRFYGFYLLVYGALVCLYFAGNLVTMYLFYEFMTLASFPLVLHNGSREAIMAGLKYLFYSLCGAYMGLFGIFLLHHVFGTAAFSPGGILRQEAVRGQEELLLTAVLLLVVGFGAKAGMFPLHAWLPAAHPVAPSPASAVLSGVLVKSGVLAILRVVYYVVGPDFLRGTWVQYVWMTLALITIGMGSLLACREPVLKKRLAYSTVSQLSYILFGLAVLSPEGLVGALLHVAFHGVIKSGLFLTAGVFLHCCGKTEAEELRGIGCTMPTMLWGYTLLALALIGIPPACGFVSKWYLAQGALEAGLGVWGYVGAAVLLLSAILTAGYLLPIVTRGFFGNGPAPQTGRQEPGAAMLLPLLVLAALSMVLGLLPGILTEYAGIIAQSTM